MTQDDKNGVPRIRTGAIRWLNKTVRTTIENTVSEYLGQAWKIKSGADLGDFACHDCAVVSDGSFAVFFKYDETANARQQFETEQSDLQFLSMKAGIMTPRPVDIVQSANGWIFIMEALETIRRRPPQWRQIGATLARIHKVKGDRFGFERDGFWGPLNQDNTPSPDWATFFGERRLRPLLGVAVDSGNIPSDVISKVEALISRLPELCGPEIEPTLLHGDAQQNNFISTAEGTFVIDPAIHYGNPETDLALIDSFQPVPDEVFDAYRDEMPINSGFHERRDLWRIPLYLAAVAIEGPMHLRKLTDAIRTYM
jgi:fructosamine-3-kinase